MNETHNKHVKAEFDNGRASILQNMQQLIKQQNYLIIKNSSANQVTAEAIYNLYSSYNPR